MSKTYNSFPKGKIFRTPKTTNTKRSLSFKDSDLLDYGIKAKSIHSFANAYDDKVIASLKNKNNK